MMAQDGRRPRQTGLTDQKHCGVVWRDRFVGTPNCRMWPPSLRFDRRVIAAFPRGQGGRYDDGESAPVQWDAILNRLACVGLIVTLMFPLGRMVFPHVAHEIGDLPFGAIEAMLSAVMGIGLHLALFG
jgi:hypothetical protein